MRPLRLTPAGSKTDHQSLCREIKAGKDPKAWLAAEMARVPIDVSK